jgi:sortase A
MGHWGTWSRMIFYSLGRLGEGDRIVLKDRTGRTYEYRVSESFLAEPSESWVMGQVLGRDMLMLQTCTPIPTFQKRLIVRADCV